MRFCSIYKYVYNGEIIYIGKSDVDLWHRIKGHEKEDKFRPYLKRVKIYYFSCNNPAETTIYETYLINKYKPILNTAMKYYDTIDFNIPEPEWYDCKYKYIDETSQIIQELFKQVCQEHIRKGTLDKANVVDEVTGILIEKGIL